MKNNIPLGLVGGFGAALIGAVIWSVITVSTGYQIGWIAIGVGFLAGIGVRMLGEGTTPVFGVIGAVFALIGCVLGNFFSMIAFVAQQFELKFFEVLSEFDYSHTFTTLKEFTEPMDFLFYAIAAWEGFKFGKIEEGKSEF